MPYGHGFVAAEAQRSWHQPQENFNPRSPPNPSKRPRFESKEHPEKSSNRHTSHNQTPPNQVPDTSAHRVLASIRSLSQQIKIEQPYRRSVHQVEDVLLVRDPGNNSSRPSNKDIKSEDDVVIINSSSQFKQNSNNTPIVDLTGDDEENRVERNNKENTSVHNIVCETTHEVSKNKKAAANYGSQAVPPLVLRKSNENTSNWSVQRPTVSNRVSTGATESSRTDANPNIIENISSGSNKSNRVVPSSSMSNYTSSKAQDRIEVHAGSRKEPHENVATLSLDQRIDFLRQASTSVLTTQHKKNKPGPWCSKPSSYREKNIQDSVIDRNLPQDDSNSGNPGAASADVDSENSDESDSGKSTKSVSSNSLSSLSDETTTEESETSDSPDDTDNSSNEASSLPCKRKSQDDKVFIPIRKKPRAIVESDSESEDDIIILDNENEQVIGNPLPSTSKTIVTFNKKRNASESKISSVKASTSKHHKTSSMKAKPVENSSVHKSVTSKSEDKTKSVKQKVPEKMHKSLPKSNLPRQQEGKKRHTINNRKKLVVLLKRLSPHEISKFSATNKSAVLHQKDVLLQTKYFISFIEQLIKSNSRIFLMNHVNNSKELSNQLLHYSNRSECALVEIKYLFSEHSKITFKTLFNPEIDIRKMYKSFLDFRKNSSKKLNHFTIFTNFELAVENLKSNKVNVKHENGRYHLSVQEGHELHQKFVKCLTLHNLAELLYQCIEQRKQKNFNTELIKKYHLALVKEKVFRIHNNRNSKGKQIQEAKLHPDFIRNLALSDAARELRRHLTDIMRCQPQASMGFVLTDPFGKDGNLDPNPQVDAVGVAEALWSKDPVKLLTCKDELKKIIGHVLEKIKSNIFGFSREFLEGNVPGNLKALRRQLTVWCDHRKIEFIKFCRDYVVSINDFDNYPVHRLPNENGKKLFEEFFNIFNFANIQKHIHLNKDIGKINNEACLNAVQEEILTGLISENLGKESFDSMLKVVSKNEIISHKPPQPKINIEFHDDVINTFQKKLPKHGFILCLTRSISLTNAIVKQLATKLGYAEDKECLFTTNKVLLEKTNDVLNAFADKSTQLLVVHWNKLMGQNSKVLDVFSKLNNAVRNEAAADSMKSIIFIVVHKDYPSQMNTIFSNKIRDEEHLFQLSEESRVDLLHSKNICLQGRGLSLSNLIVDEHVPILLESTEVLSKLLTGKLVIGKSLVRPDGFKESLFKTQIKQCIIINPAIFHEQINDVFILRNIDRKDLEQFLPARQKILAPNDVPASMRINGRYILLGFNVSQSFFNDYVEKNRDRDVHLLRFESGSFIWENTYGNNKDLLRNRLDNTDDLLIKQEVVDVVSEGPKTIIISGDSGSGKSVCLYNLAKETKNLYNIESTDACWPVQVNLDKVRLSKYVKKNINMARKKDFVAEFLSNYLDLDTVQRKILTMIFQNQLKIKLSLFFDNYEELPTSHRKFVIQLLQELQVSYCEKIYVTSTPNTSAELEVALAVFSYTLEFSEVEKMLFLQKFWSKKFGEIDFTNEAGNLIDYYSKIESKDEDLTALPLHLKMLAAMHNPNDENYTRIESQDELYKLYIKYKGMKDMESVCLYSLRKVLKDDQLKTLNLDHPKKGFSLPDDLRHRTFFEYISAKWLGAHNHPLTKFISLLDSVSPLFLKTYLAELSTSDDMVKVLGEFAANGHLNHFKMMLADCKGKLSLTKIIRSNSLNSRQSIRFLLDHYNDTNDEIMLHGEFKEKKYAEANIVKYVNRRDKSRKETPLEVAAKVKNIPIACELLLKGANIDGIDDEFITDVARYIADEMCKSDSEWLHPIAEKLFKIRPNAVAHLEKTTEYPRLLSYFYTHGRVDLIKLLLKNDPRERYNILVAQVDNKTPLDLVNESRVLSDDERLEITKYIVNNVGEDLDRRNKYYLANVLKAAAECSHKRTFEYFIAKYPEKHMGFLEKAMKSNRLDLMRFLMSKTDRMMYPNENTALHKAVSLGVSLTTMKFLINKGGIDNKNKFGETPLCIAFKEGQDFELIKYLIKRDADLTTKDELGLYPWCYAILEESKYTAEEQMFIIKYLQERDLLRALETEQMISIESDPKRKEVAKKLKFIQKPQGFISLNLEMHIALKSNNENWIKFLIRQGADVNHKSDGRMPLHIAIDFKRYRLAKMLLDYGAIFNAKDKFDKTPLQLLMANGDDSKESKEIENLLETAKRLFEGGEKYSSQVSRHLINCRDKQGQTLLHIAAKHGNLNAIKDIIKNSKDYSIRYKDFPSIDVNAKDEKKQTPLYLANRDNKDVVKELLANGAIFEPANTSFLKSAKHLIQAVKDKDVGKVKELVKDDCLVNAKDESLKSCLHYAAICDCIEIMKILLAVRISDVDTVDSNLQTPLHYAVENDNIQCMVLLLKAGASYDIKNKSGNRPFDLTNTANESLKLLKKIDKMFVDIKSDEPRIFNNENPEALDEYLAEIEKTWSLPKEIVVNVVDNKKNTLLHIATKFDFHLVVENLVKQGAIYNARNREKKTPESMAISTKQFFRNVRDAFHNLTVTAWIKLEPEVLVNLRSNDGYTLLNRCAYLGKKEEVRWLLENDADVKATSNRGYKIKCDKKRYPEVYEMLFRD